jgi:hypothetical protein
MSFAIHERSLGSSAANIERAEDRHLNAEDAMLPSLTNESSGSELDTLKFWMMGSDPLSRMGQQIKMVGSRRVGQRVAASE